MEPIERSLDLIKAYHKRPKDDDTSVTRTHRRRKDDSPFTHAIGSHHRQHPESLAASGHCLTNPNLLSLGTLLSRKGWSSFAALRVAPAADDSGCESLAAE